MILPDFMHKIKIEDNKLLNLDHLFIDLPKQTQQVVL
jgi:hypothetical protein